MFSILSKFQRTKAERIFSKSTQSVAQLFNVSRHQIQRSSQWNKNRQSNDISEHDEAQDVPKAQIADVTSLIFFNVAKKYATKPYTCKHNLATQDMRHPSLFRPDTQDDEAHLFSFRFCFQLHKLHQAPHLSVQCAALINDSSQEQGRCLLIRCLSSRHDAQRAGKAN